MSRACFSGQNRCGVFPVEGSALVPGGAAFLSYIGGQWSVGCPGGKSRVAREPPLALHQGHISRPKAHFVEDSWENLCDFTVAVGMYGWCRMNEIAVSHPKLVFSRAKLLFFASETAVLASEVDGTEKRDPVTDSSLSGNWMLKTARN